jgi:hypothetical protein
MVMTEFSRAVAATTDAMNSLDPMGKMGSPEDILAEATMSIEEKRALLASWASDAHAVPDMPMYRQLDDGSLVTVDEILRALKALDGANASRTPGRSDFSVWLAPFNRRSKGRFRRLMKTAAQPGDDDDPPPSPVRARVPASGGEATFTWPDPLSWRTAA